MKLNSTHKHYTRHTSNKFHLHTVNTSYDQKMLSFAGVRLFSELDPVLKLLGWLSLKKLLKRKILKKYND